MNKNIGIALSLGIILVVASIWYAGRDSGRDESDPSPASVSVIDGRQVIEVLARGGYTPHKINAQAGIPTVLKVRTQNTFDCSASLVIPQMNYRKMLSPLGTEEIVISAEKAQGVLRGLCSMGMYGFEINFL
ncbi:MAG: cupredoxin domain-containing protein [Candidatus Liptonbacteria bacterium]